MSKDTDDVEKGGSAFMRSKSILPPSVRGKVKMIGVPFSGL